MLYRSCCALVVNVTGNVSCNFGLQVVPTQQRQRGNPTFLRCKACGLQVMWLTVCTAVVGYVPEGSFKRWLNYKVSVMCFAVLSSALSAVITYNNPENRPVRGICVANHTSPIDVLVLMCDNCYSLVCFCLQIWISFYNCFFVQTIFFALLIHQIFPNIFKMTIIP